MFLSPTFFHQTNLKEIELLLCSKLYINEGMAKKCKKISSHGGFLRKDQDRAKKYFRIGCDILQVAQKAIIGIQIQLPHKAQ